MPLALRTASLAALICLALLLGATARHPALAAPEDEVRATFDRFVAAQNAHDEKALAGLLLDSPDFLWITRGTAVWGHDQAMKRFAGLFQGYVAARARSIRAQSDDDRRGCRSAFRADRLHHWNRRSACADHDVSDESGPPQDR